MSYYLYSSKEAEVLCANKASLCLFSTVTINFISFMRSGEVRHHLRTDLVVTSMERFREEELVVFESNYYVVKTGERQPEAAVMSYS